MPPYADRGITRGFVHHVASTPSAGCAGLCVQVLGGRPHDDRVHTGRNPVYVKHVCVHLIDVAWGLPVCRMIVSFTMVLHGESNIGQASPCS